MFSACKEKQVLAVETRGHNAVRAPLPGDLGVPGAQAGTSRALHPAVHSLQDGAVLLSLAIHSHPHLPLKNHVDSLISLEVVCHWHASCLSHLIPSEAQKADA